MSLLTYLPPVGSAVPEPEDLYEAYSFWASETGRPLYPHQEEALLEVFTGNHVVLATPTGSGKSLVAMGAQYAALAAHRAGQTHQSSQGGRTFYTAPLKALVSEKFFDLVDAFGAANVGMITGDSSINADAPVICCTAEILANLALRTGPGNPDDPQRVSQVIMDEFHFYGDPQRGWAWQVPLLELTDAQFVLMSATLGDTTSLREDLAERTGRPAVEVASAERPVPLEFEYVIEPITEVLERLVQQGRAPVYIVHFTQGEAVERAQALLSANLATRAEKDAIADEIGDFRFGTGFGKTLSRFVRAGVGVHHAGMLPKYRRLVERLTQRGLMKVICGTDTLGVGINVPIRTVLFTSLVKYDGERSRHLSAREFHQIAGRAGRAGFDTLGEVLVMAPEHVIENRRALAKAGDDPKKQRKIVRKQAPAGAVNWTEATFERLRDADPEPLVGQFAVTHAMVLGVLSRPGDPIEAMRHLLTANHDSPGVQERHIRQAMRIYRSLRRAEVIEKTQVAGEPHVRLAHDIPREFALNQALSPFALAAMDLLNVDDPAHAEDVVSVIEATLDDPRQVLRAQEKAARGAAIAEMKAEGLDYDERMARLEDVTYPRPLQDLLEPAFVLYARSNPWVMDAELSEKSVVRDLLSTGDSFTQFISRYQLDRSEGVALRYLADAYRALRQVVPLEHRTAEVEEIIEWLGELVRGVDSTLLDEWEKLAHPEAAARAAIDAQEAREDETLRAVTGNAAAWRRLVRNAMYRLVELSSREDYAALAAAAGGDWTADTLADALDPLFVEQGDEAINTGANARGPALFSVLETSATAWQVRQVFDDYDGHHDWAIWATVDLPASDAADEVVLTVDRIGPIELGTAA